MPAPQPVYSQPATQSYNGGPGDYLDAGHNGALALPQGTVSVGFSLSGTQGRFALISKDSSGTNAGDFTVWITDGQLKVTLESDGTSRTLRVPEIHLEAGTQYQFAMSFGGDGLSLWLNGDLVAADPEFTQGIQMNDSGLVVGGTRAWRDPDDEAHSLFRGEIGDVKIYDQQLGEADMLALAADVSPVLDDAARMADAMDKLAPSFTQAHHGSHTFKKILEDFGVSAHGHINQPLTMQSGGAQADALDGTAGNDGINGLGGNDTINGQDGDDVLQGGYGNDDLKGDDGNDILDGGHGEDVLDGGDGNDLLISRSDAREPDVAYDPNRDEGDPDNELTNGKLYPNQPIPGNDIMIGGGGADIFYFQTLINAKERFVREHTRDDGTINWHGVAGENDDIHDHWVDSIGDDVVMDFSRAEGDRIVIEGHTTEIGSITYGDANGDGVMDHSVIQLYSDQGSNGGAHNDDKLGTITVYGDLVMHSDIEHTAAPAYGIISSIEDLQEALQPTVIGTSRGPIQPPASLPALDALPELNGSAPVFAAVGSFDYLPFLDSQLVFDHQPELALSAGTIAFLFNVTNLTDGNFLFSKDAKDYGNGGHLTAWVDEDGDLLVRLQDGDESHYLVAQGAVIEGATHEFAFSFGPAGAQLYLDGVRVAFVADVTTGISQNVEALIVGANGWASNPGKADSIWGQFDGTISDFLIYDQQITGTTAPKLLTQLPPVTIAHALSDCTFSVTQTGDLVVTNGPESYIVPQGTQAVNFADVTVSVPDLILGNDLAQALGGTGGNDILVGLDGNDVIKGMGGVDILSGDAGNDTLDAGSGNDHVLGGAGDDMLYGSAGFDVIHGGDGNDMLSGGGHADNLQGGTGQDTLDGGSGVDRLFGGAGDDLLIGGTSEDFLSGDAGNDTLNGDAGFDRLYGGTGNDLLSGGAQADNLFGGDGEDTLYGGQGFDRAFGGDGNDFIDGGDGPDALFGGNGDDTMYGGTGNDRFFGGVGNDYLNGGADNDAISGGAGFDVIVGGSGNDTLVGAFNADIFVFSDGFGNDVISDFAATNNFEKIDLSAVSAITNMSDLVNNHMAQVGADVIIDDLAGNTILLSGVSLGDLDANDFVF